jgi:hypothetical protein
LIKQVVKKTTKSPFNHHKPYFVPFSPAAGGSLDSKNLSAA